ncbi:hypothetical protein E2C01_000406 [Portunus trituberculatus]|uniref:Uncharacterized protein n=1 Tax=Portunus trituberculatus TaxID=210409 RepID=A0A5B7CE89_PORTR|nr:hypothetical protein [Portunus trituberculatus]
MLSANRTPAQPAFLPDLARPGHNTRATATGRPHPPHPGPLLGCRGRGGADAVGGALSLGGAEWEVSGRCSEAASHSLAPPALLYLLTLTFPHSVPSLPPCSRSLILFPLF